MLSEMGLVTEETARPSGAVRKIDLNNFKVAHSGTARDINRRIVLNLIRRNEPISRASLARQSGLQRSTVSAITEQLLEECWVIEGASGQLPRGRRPTFLHLNHDRVGIVGVDIQPERTTLGVTGLDSKFIAQESMPTAKDPVEFISKLSRRILDLMRAHPRSHYEGIGVSLPGRVDAASRRIFFVPNLGWGELDLKTPLEKATGLPVELENAANACALAESWSGRHTEHVSNLIAVTVSEGIGVGMIVNGQLVQGSTGAAGEFGHVSLDPNGPPCRCGSRGCWEVLASNSAAVRYYAQSATHRKGEVGSKSDMATLSFSDMLRLVEQGDAKACSALDQMAHNLGTGIAMLASGLAPDVVVVIGEVTRVWSRVGPIVEAAVRQKSLTGVRVRIVPTDPDASPRLRGTIALVLQQHFGAPFIA
jgi:predicted NBD/HSP70 family sugar kinase